MNTINWTRIAEAIEFYKTNGFTYIETPWHVDKDIAMMTCPNEKQLVNTSREWQRPNLRRSPQSLVGSAEQSFLQLSHFGQIEDSMYVSAGPCFREEPTYDELHWPQFFKVELFARFDNDEDARHAFKYFLSTAKTFMEKHTSRPVELVDTQFGWDLEVNGVEVGSYGCRYDRDIGFWAYGTGLAEPRFSQAL